MSQPWSWPSWRGVVKCSSESHTVLSLVPPVSRLLRVSVFTIEHCPYGICSGTKLTSRGYGDGSLDEGACVQTCCHPLDVNRAWEPVGPLTQNIHQEWAEPGRKTKHMVCWEGHKTRLNSAWDCGGTNFFQAARQQSLWYRANGVSISDQTSLPQSIPQDGFLLRCWPFHALRVWKNKICQYLHSWSLILTLKAI